MNNLKFIRLTSRHGKTSILFNPYHIVAIKDLRTDSNVSKDSGFAYTVIYTASHCASYEVKETESEIMEMIAKL